MIEPGALDATARKAVLRQLTYGLYAVTTHHEGQVNAFTANWVTQVSFEPPMVAISVENDCHSIDLIRASGVFAINVCHEGQRELAGRLGRSLRRAPDKLTGLSYRPGLTGCPLLADTLGAIECQVTGSLAAGDSTLFVAEVIAATLLGAAGPPLTMAAAGFRHSG